MMNEMEKPNYDCIAYDSGNELEDLKQYKIDLEKHTTSVESELEKLKAELKTHEDLHNISCRFSTKNMVEFGNFIRDNYHGNGTPCLISYDCRKYPHGTIDDIFVIWCCENGY